MRMTRRVMVRFGMLWVVGAAVVSWLTIQAWAMGADGAVRPLGNLAWIVALPGWVVVAFVPTTGRRSDPVMITMASTIGWGCWVVGMMMVWWVRSHLMARWARSGGDTELAMPSRRVFMANSALGSVAVCGAAVPGYATLVEPWGIKVRRYEIPIRDLPVGLDGLRVVQVSDTHLGPRIPESFVARAYAMALAESPDLVVLTGDHVHDGVREHERAAALCRVLVEGCPMGVLGVLGNHDWWGDGHRLSQMLGAVGVRMIDNDRVWLDASRRRIVDAEPDGASMAIVGLGDLTDYEIDLDRAFAGVGEGTPRLVLAHNPDTAEIGTLVGEQSPRVDLMMSGHTHGGQVKIPFLGTPIVPSYYGQKYAGGLVEGPAFRVVVSRGVGMSMLPVRVGVPPEIGVITLRRMV